MKNSFFVQAIILTSLLTACSATLNKEEAKPAPTIVSHDSPRHQDFRFTTVQEAYEAEAFFDMISLMETEQDVYKMHKQFIPAVGRDKFEYSDGAWGNYEKCDDGQVIKREALDQILKMTKNARIVIINEAHDTSQHREFIAHLLPFLSEQGFNIYGAETFSIANSSTAEWKAKISEYGHEGVSGFYLSDPAFSRLVNKALKLDFELIAYEFEGVVPQGLSISDRIRLREEGQAKNIWERALSSPQNRVILHVGHSHVKEEVDKRGRSWLASILKYQYNIDPVTISQTNCSMTETAKGWGFSLPDENSGVDLKIHSMPETLTNKRPNWYDLLGYKRYSANQFVSGNFVNAIVEATFEDSGSIADRVFFKHDETIDLVLKPGKYTITVAVDGGEKFLTDVIVVE